MKFKRLITGLAATILVAGTLGQALVGTVHAAGNLISNPSVETASGSLPVGWSTGNWGTNTATFAYESAGAEDGTHDLSVTVSGYTSGDAKWYFTPVAVTGGTQYTYTDYYQSTAASQLDAQVTDAAGNVSYLWLADLPAAASWTPASVNFVAPAGASVVTIFHVIATNGTLRTDNFSLSPTVIATPTPTPSPSPSSSPTPSPTPSPSPSPTPTPTPTPGSIPNPGLEIAAGTAPASWWTSGWGTNTATYAYLNTGHSGTHSIKTTVTNFTSGDANWGYAPQPVTAGQYEFTDWYQSNVNTEVDAGVTMSDGTTQYFYVTTVVPSTSWAQAKGVFQVPAGATAITLFHLIAHNGYLITDDYSFLPYTPAPFNRGLVSVTFDDGWQDQYTNGLPILKKYGINSTFYIISGEINDTPDYMSLAEIISLKKAGMEIASHTVTHPDLTTLTTTQVTNQMKNSQATLQKDLGISIPDFAYPYGAYNSTTLGIGANYYQTQRSVDSGYNTKDMTNLRVLKVQNIFNTTTPAQVQAWINQAAAEHAWLILVYHEVAVVPSDPTDTTYDTQPSDLDTEMAAVKNSGLGVVTIHQAISEILPQL